MTDAQTNSVQQTGPTREELYAQWLDLHTHNPSYYGLLGLPELESDEEAIQQAGRRIKRKLRAYQIGTYRKQALELLAKWKPAIADTYQLYCAGTSHDASALEGWLNTCQARSIPVTRLLPAMIRSLGPELGRWPPQGGHSMSLPLNMWLYRDVIILAQCIPHGSLEHRGESVKHIQRVLGLTEGLARIVAEEVTRSQHLFSHLRLAAVARRDPVRLLVRLGQRIRRYGGHLGRHAKIIVAVAKLIGVKSVELKQSIDHLAADHEKSSSQRMALPGRGGSGKRGKAAGSRLEDLVGDRPLGLVIAAAAVAGVVVLTLLLVIVSAILTAAYTPPHPITSTDKVRPLDMPSHEVVPAPTPAEIEALKEYSKKYANKPTSDTPDAEATGESDDSRPATTFFSVPARKGSTSPSKSASK